MIRNNPTTNTLEFRRKRSTPLGVAGNIVKNSCKSVFGTADLVVTIPHNICHLNVEDTKYLTYQIYKSSIKAPYKGIKNLLETKIKHEKSFVSKELRKTLSENLLDRNTQGVTDTIVVDSTINISSAGNRENTDYHVTYDLLKKLKTGILGNDIEKAFLIKTLEHYNIVESTAKKLGATEDTQEDFENKIWSTLGLPDTEDARNEFYNNTIQSSRAERLRKEEAFRMQQIENRYKITPNKDLIKEIPHADEAQIADIKLSIDKDSICAITLSGITPDEEGNSIQNPVVLADKQKGIYQLYEAGYLCEALKIKPENPLTKEALTFTELLKPTTEDNRILFRINKDDFVNHTIEK